MQKQSTLCYPTILPSRSRHAHMREISAIAISAFKIRLGSFRMQLKRCRSAASLALFQPPAVSRPPPSDESSRARFYARRTGYKSSFQLHRFHRSFLPRNCQSAQQDAFRVLGRGAFRSLFPGGGSHSNYPYYGLSIWSGRS